MTTDTPRYDAGGALVHTNVVRFSDTENNTLTNQQKGWLVQRAVEALFCNTPTDAPVYMSTLRVTCTTPEGPAGIREIRARIITQRGTSHE